MITILQSHTQHGNTRRQYPIMRLRHPMMMTEISDCLGATDNEED